MLAPSSGFPDRERIRLQRFLIGIRVTTTHDAQLRTSRTPRVVKKITNAGANQLNFRLREGQQMTVSDYFLRTHNRRLTFPTLPCVEVGSGALLPLELCMIEEGQIMRKQVPPEKTKDVLDFATKKPADRLRSIAEGLNVLQYGQSEYVKQFGMKVSPNAGPLKISARVLPAPTLKYGLGSRQAAIVSPLVTLNVYLCQ